MKIIISNNPEALRAAAPTVTVEAEYGDAVVEGTMATFAHHGARGANPCPCMDPRAAEVSKNLAEDAVIGVSHFDLDTLGCLILVMGLFKDMGAALLDMAGRFFELGAFVDVNGPHRADREHPCYGMLCAFWAWGEKNKVFPPRDGSVADITAKVLEGADVVRGILTGDPELMAAGKAFIEKEDALNTNSLRDWKRDVALRMSDQFTNHLYSHPWDGSMARAVVALNTKFKSVTVSLESPIPGVSCREIVQKLWGPLAGGHDGIAGSPRGQEMTEADLISAAEATAEALKPQA